MGAFELLNFSESYLIKTTKKYATAVKANHNPKLKMSNSAPLSASSIQGVE